MFQCDCYEWIDGVKEINGMIQLANVHRIVFTVPKFKFCPWCGKELKEVKNEN